MTSSNGTYSQCVCPSASCIDQLFSDSGILSLLRHGDHVQADALSCGIDLFMHSRNCHAFSRLSLRSVINCSFCFTAWSLTPLARLSVTISMVCSLYSQVFVVLLHSFQRFHLLAAVGFAFELTCSPVTVSRIWCLRPAPQTSMCERFCLFVVSPLHITTSLSARHPLLCGALLRFEILQIRPAIVGIRSA